MKTVPIAELVEDFDVYPRTQVDSHNVSGIVEAMQAGCKMPPITIDKKSRRIVDGFHRVRAARRVDGDEATIEVEEISYKNDRELFLAAMRANAQHGRKITPFERMRCVGIAAHLHIDQKAVAEALNVTSAHLENLTATRMGRDKLTPVPLKQTFKHMGGQRLTKQQLEVNARSGGMNALFFVNQLIDLLGADMLDNANEALAEGLIKLGKLIDEKVGTTV